ncbi:ribonuclease-3 [Parelusimicrobium proximum]|uniref:ribonuclease III n=1 Tax=Parelusimicrobium proximum TaxID=3228953 RepID=UPI003D18013A
MSKQVEDLIKYHFKDKDLIKEALTHKSFSGGSHHIKDNERLEFLGDSILGMLTAEHLYNKYPDVEEGVLSKIKSSAVSRHNLYLWASELGLGKHIQMASSEAATGGRTRESILSNAMEAVIGAVYLDGGFEAARELVGKWLEGQNLKSRDVEDYKSTLQEYYQKKHKNPPVYEIVQTVGPEHDKIFTVAVLLDGKEIAKGKGKNKKLAEQAAAQSAMEQLK